MHITPEWLRERNNDGCGTPNKHPFWDSVTFEIIGVWKIFEKDGVWYGYKTTQNAWAHFTDRADAIRMASAKQTDVWA
jgi:hypothetical protein